MTQSFAKRLNSRKKTDGAVTIDLNPNMEARLLQGAAHQGQDLSAVVEELISLVLEWEAQEREEAIEGIQRGLEAGEAGRVRPAEAVFAEMRARL